MKNNQNIFVALSRAKYNNKDNLYYIVASTFFLLRRGKNWTTLNFVKEPNDIILMNFIICM